MACRTASQPAVTATPGSLLPLSNLSTLITRIRLLLARDRGSLDNVLPLVLPLVRDACLPAESGHELGRRQHRLRRWTLRIASSRSAFG
jgi:hypothetical protein